MIGKKNKGAPTKYRPEYCEKLIDYFNIDPFETIKDQEGQDTGIYRHKFPSLERFAQSINVSVDSLDRWAVKYPDFCGAIKKGHQLQKSFLIESAMYGLTNPAFSIFAAKNIFGWSDQGPKEYAPINFARCRTMEQKQDKVIREAANGNITMEQARQWGETIKNLVTIKQATSFEERLEQIEADLHEKRTGKTS